MPIRPFLQARVGQSPERIAAISCAAIAFAAAWLAAVRLPGNVDVSWLLTIGDRLLDGARLHSDIVEINPPLSAWLYLPFAWAGRVTAIPAEIWLACGLSALALASLALVAQILRGSGTSSGMRAWFWPAALFVTLCLFPRDFAQREQFAAIALLPWLALLAARDGHPSFAAGNVWHHVLAGFGAAFFVAIKPPLATLALALPALHLSAARRSLRPLLTTETIIGAVSTLAYLAWLAAFHRAFFTDILPVVRDFYFPMRMSAAAMLSLWPVMTFAAFVITIVVAARPAGIYPLAMIMLLAGAGYLPAFVLMGKGWSYQALPSLIFAVLALLVQLSRPGRNAPLLSRVGSVAGLVLLAQLFASELLALRGGQDVASPAVAIDAAVDRPTIASIATRLQPAFPLVRMVGGRFVSRYPAFWWADNAVALIGSAESGARTRLAAQLDNLIARSAAETAAARPEIIIDGGSRETPGQRSVREHPAVIDLLGSYQVLYGDADVTVWLRSDIAAPSPLVR